jgi:chromosome segregation ATPase
VVGANDVGKSSLLRALRWVLEDLKGSDFIRDGQERAQVELQIDDTVIVRSKGPKENRYIINGTVFDSIGYGSPEEVTRQLNLLPLKIDADTVVNLTLSEQLDAHFLIFDKGTIKARFLGSLTGVNRIDAALRSTNKQLEETKRSTKDLASRQAVIQEQLIQVKKELERL